MYGVNEGDGYALSHEQLLVRDLLLYSMRQLHDMRNLLPLRGGHIRGFHINIGGGVLFIKGRRETP